jgi:membrane-associated phospholipid phosphatase
VRRAAPLLHLAVALALAPPLPARAADELAVDVPTTAIVTGSALALWAAGELGASALVPDTCRWCEPPALDRRARDALRWGDPATAGLLSNVAVLALPAALTARVYLASGGDLRRTGEDALVVAETVALTEVATTVVKVTVARRRPYAWAAGQRVSADDDLSFFSGHASAAFAMAGAFGTVAQLRGDPAWPVVYAVGFPAAALVAYLRVGADKHWLTDVAVGAAVGTVSGLVLPRLLHRRAPGAPTVSLTAVPLGVAGTF